MAEVIPIRFTAFADSEWCAVPTDIGAVIYNAGSERVAEARDLLGRLVVGECNLDEYPSLGGGSEGEVFAVGDFAVKRFRDEARRYPFISGLPHLQASVALHEGLRAAKQPVTDESGVDFLFAAPEMHASFVPDGSAAFPYAIMTRVEGESSGDTNLPVPSQALSESMYKQAQIAAGVPNCALLDPRAEDTLVSELPSGLILVTRLDIKGRGGPAQQVDAETFARQPRFRTQ